MGILGQVALSDEERDRIALSVVVFVVLFAQILLYPGIADLVEVLGASPAINAGAVFVGVEFVAYVVFAGVWGGLSDSQGRRVSLVVVASVVASVAYLGIAFVPVAGVGFGSALALRFVQGGATVGGFSLALTTLMDLGGRHGHNMGAAGVAIGAGVGFGAPVGGFVYELGPLYPLYATPPRSSLRRRLSSHTPSKTAHPRPTAACRAPSNVSSRHPRSPSRTRSASSTASPRASSPSSARSTSAKRSASVPPRRA